MECEKVRNLLSEYVDGDCPNAAVIGAHLDHCPDCAGAHRQMVALLRIVKSLPEHSAPSGFTVSVRERIAAKEANTSALQRWLGNLSWKPALGITATAGLAVALAFTFMNRSQDETPVVTGGDPPIVRAASDLHLEFIATSVDPPNSERQPSVAEVGAL